MKLTTAVPAPPVTDGALMVAGSPPRPMFSVPEEPAELARTIAPELTVTLSSAVRLPVPAEPTVKPFVLVQVLELPPVISTDPLEPVAAPRTVLSVVNLPELVRFSVPVPSWPTTREPEVVTVPPDIFNPAFAKPAVANVMLLVPETLAPAPTFTSPPEIVVEPLYVLAPVRVTACPC